MNTKPAFFQVDRRIVNRYEVREVQLTETPKGVPVAVITYKDGTKVITRGTSVPRFAAWILDKNETNIYRSWLDQSEVF